MATPQEEQQPVPPATGFSLADRAGQKAGGRLRRFFRGAPVPQQEEAPQDTAPTVRRPSGDEDFENLTRAIAFSFGISQRDQTFLYVLPQIADFRVTRLPTTDAPETHIDAHGLEVEIAAGKVHTEKTGLTVEEARNLAILALANPVMREKGVTLEGSPSDRRLLADAARAFNLKILNEPEDLSPEDEKIVDETYFRHAQSLPENKDLPPVGDEMRTFLRDELKKNGAPEIDLTDEALERRWIAMGQDNRNQAELFRKMRTQKPAEAETAPAGDGETPDMGALREAIEKIQAQSAQQAGPSSPIPAKGKNDTAGDDKEASDVEGPAAGDSRPVPTRDFNRAALPENIAAMLREGRVEEDKYHEARELVVSEQKASQNLLRTRLHIGARRAGILMETLAADGIIKTESEISTRSRTRTEVLVKPGDRPEIAVPRAPGP